MNTARSYEDWADVWREAGWLCESQATCTTCGSAVGERCRLRKMDASPSWFENYKAALAEVACRSANA